MAYGTINTDLITNSNGLSGNAIGPGFKNRIINGAMMIDQRNAGASASITTSDVYYLDRFNVKMQTGSGHTIIRSTTAPTGFINSLFITVGTGGSPAAANNNYLNQWIEGFNVADLAWGTASAKTITLSFWVRSSLTGTFSGVLRNDAGNRCYPFTYNISSANTFEKKSITIAGDTTGTWLTNNSGGVGVFFDLGTGSTYQGTAGAWAASDYRAASGCTQLVATSGATLYITGLQFEVGSTATSFDYRPYGTELALCQRYYEVINDGRLVWCGITVSGVTYARTATSYAMVKRAVATVTTTNTDRAGFGTGAGTVDKNSVSGFYVYLVSNGSSNDSYVFWSATASAEL